jgi:molybdopterin synthase catalytic subunit
MRIVRRDGERQGSNTELLKAIETQNRLHDTLKLLFELLEKYAPLWYKEHYRDQAEWALHLPLARTFPIDQHLASGKQFKGRKKAA